MSLRRLGGLVLACVLLGGSVASADVQVAPGTVLVAGEYRPSEFSVRGALFAIDPASGEQRLLSDLLDASQGVLGITGGPDLLRGLGGVDHLIGGRGADQLGGGAGRDLLRGDHGADRLDGGDDADRLGGGSDACRGETRLCCETIEDDG